MPTKIIYRPIQVSNSRKRTSRSAYMQQMAEQENRPGRLRMFPGVQQVRPVGFCNGLSEPRATAQREPAGHQYNTDTNHNSHIQSSIILVYSCADRTLISERNSSPVHQRRRCKMCPPSAIFRLSIASQPVQHHSAQPVSSTMGGLLQHSPNKFHCTAAPAHRCHSRLRLVERPPISCNCNTESKQHSRRPRAPC